MANEEIFFKKSVPTWKVVVCSLLGFILLSSAALIVRNYLNEPAVVDQKIVDERVERLKKLREEMVQAKTQYAWEDKATGVVRIPLEAALNLALPEIRNRVLQKSNVLVDPIVAAAPATAVPAEAAPGVKK
ncbi:MAG: hypothetical protein SH807_09990 [Blastochloris sp.]|jgi:hypothetical protein|nr:hypothetical protein [Blastochloris sp.]